MPIQIANLTPIDVADVSDTDILIVVDAEAATPRERSLTVGNLKADVVRGGGDATLGAVTATTLSATSGVVDSLEVTTELVFPSTTSVTDLFTAALACAHADILAGASETVTIGSTGSLTSDRVILTADGELPDGLVAQAWVPSAGNISVKLFNASGSTVSAATQNLTAFIVRTS